MKHTIVYIPGLGDHYDELRRRALSSWETSEVSVALLPMRWYDPLETFEQKLRRAADSISAYQRLGHTVSVVGESAGGTMAIHVFALNHKVHRLVTIAGVNRPDVTVSPVTLRRAPAFGPSITALTDSLDAVPVERRASIHVITGLHDATVNERHSYIFGAHRHRVWVIGHIFVIAVCLTVWRGVVRRLAV